MPIIGRVIRNTAEKLLHSRKPPTNPLKPEGHIGQVVPLEDGVAILESCAAEPLIQNNCMCRCMTRGIKEPCCINFGVMSEIVDKLPRFIPEKEKYHLSRSEAVARFTRFNRRGYIGTIWCGPDPCINNLCSCEDPECAGTRLRLDFGITSISKAEHVVRLRGEACTGCMKCTQMCPFAALSFDPKAGKAAVKREVCWGCGVCRHASSENLAHAHVCAAARLAPGSTVAGKCHFVGDHKPDSNLFDFMEPYLRALGLPVPRRSIPRWLALAMAAVVEAVAPSKTWGTAGQTVQAVRAAPG